MAAFIVTVGATRRQLVVTIVDTNGNVVPLSATLANLQLQGRSRDLAAVTINSNAFAVDAPNGVITFDSIGTLVTQSNLTTAAIHKATYRLKVKYVDNAGKTDFTDSFEGIWDEDPLQLP